MKVRSIKLKKYSSISKNIANSRLYLGKNKLTFHPQNLRYLKGFRKNFVVLDVNKIELSLKKVLKLIYNLNKKNKRILFIGLPELKDKLFSTKNSHDFISHNFWVPGILSNKLNVLNNFKLHNYKDLKVMNVTKIPDLIVILDNNFDRSFLSEIYKLNIPVVSLINYSQNFENIDFKLFGNMMYKESSNFIYSLLKIVLKNK